MTYQTNNPVGSVDVRDLYDNAVAFDNFSAGPLDAYPDRFGVPRQSLQGIRNASQYQVIGAYAAGLVFTSRNQVFSYLGEFYATGPAIVLPYTTTGVGAAEIANFRSVGDALLRQDLANLDKGAAMLGRGVVAVDSIADLLALPEGQRKEGLRYLVKGYYVGSDVGGGEFYWDASSVDSINRGTVFGGAGEGRWKRIFSGSVYVSWFGAVGDGVTDDSDAIQAAIDEVCKPGRSTSVVRLDSAIYAVAKTLRVYADGVELIGDADVGVNANISPLAYGSVQIDGRMTDGSTLLKFHKTDAAIFGGAIKGIRISNTTSHIVRPLGLQMVDCSEVSVSDFHVAGGFFAGVQIEGGTINYFDRFVIADCVRSMKLEKGSVFSSVAQLHLTRGNFWNCTYDHILFNCAGSIFVSHCWMEYAQRHFNIEQIRDEKMNVYIFLSNTEMSTATGEIAGYKPNDPYYDKANNRLVKAVAKGDASNPLTVRFNFSNATGYVEDADYAFDYIKGGNPSIGSRFAEAELHDFECWGVNYAGIASDTSYTSVSLLGFVHFWDSLISTYPVLKPPAVALVTLNAFVSTYGYTDMSAGSPLRLPQNAANDNAVSGLISYNPAVDRAAVTGASKNNVLSRCDFALVNLDAGSINLDSKNSSESLCLDYTIPTDRTIYLPSSNTFNGQKYRITRTSAASGSGVLYVSDASGVKCELSVSQWCELQTDTLKWYLVAKGSLN